MANSAKNFICFTLRDDHITAIEFERQHKGIKLISYNQISLENGIYKDGKVLKNEEFKQKLIELTSSAQPQAMTASSSIVIIENDVVFNHCFAVPHLKDLNILRKVVPQKAEEVIPFSQTELFWDYELQKLPGNQLSDQIKLQYLAIPKQISEEIMQHFKQAGFEVLILTAGMEIYKSLLLEAAPTNKHVIVIEADCERTQILYYEYNILLRIRRIDFNLRPFLEMLALQNNLTLESLLSLLVTNVQKTEELKIQDADLFFEPYFKAIKQTIKEMLGDNVSPERIFLWGEGLFVPELFKLFKKELTPSPEINVLWRSITIDHAIRQNQELVKIMNNNIIDFGITASAAFNFLKLLAEYKMLNLLPRSQQIIARNTLISGTLNRIGLGIFSLYFLLIIFLLYGTYDLNKMLADASTKLNDAISQTSNSQDAKIRSDIENYNRDITTLASVVNQLQPVPKEITQIYSFQPVGINFESLNYNSKDYTLQINGIADDRNTLLNYQNQLLEYLKNKATIDSPLSNFDRSTNAPFTLVIQFKK